MGGHNFSEFLIRQRAQKAQKKKGEISDLELLAEEIFRVMTRPKILTQKTWLPYMYSFHFFDKIFLSAQYQPLTQCRGTAVNKAHSHRCLYRAFIPARAQAIIQQYPKLPPHIIILIDKPHRQVFSNMLFRQKKKKLYFAKTKQLINGKAWFETLTSFESSCL